VSDSAVRGAVSRESSALGIHTETAAETLPWLRILFCASGFAAILYQIVWQRVLFTSFGVNVQAVTVVVTAFLAGLGVGGLVGGRLSYGGDAALLRRFGQLELAVGFFGFVSLAFFRWIGTVTAVLPSTMRGLVVALIAMAPTTLMGATLPILVAYSVRRTGNVGGSVGSLYFVNTAGSALAAFAAALALLPTLGELRTIIVAAVVNLAVGSSALLYARSAGRVG
jgi:spermidine synthase